MARALSFLKNKRQISGNKPPACRAYLPARSPYRTESAQKAVPSVLAYSKTLIRNSN
jgi:hypothetical protein